jgi:uncharacterized RDD family membrane protein YckC
LQCKKCNHQVANGIKFCTNCGEPIEIKPKMKFCPSCGSKREDQENFCTICGFQYAESKETFIESRTNEGMFHEETSFTQHHRGEASAGSYAKFGQRFLATLIDSVILFVFMFIFSSLFFPYYYGADIRVRLWGVIFGLAYKAGMESSSLQGTIGKRAMGLKVVDLQGQRISITRAIGRYFASYISALILAIGYLMALFTEKRQTLHDMIAGTLVVKK